MKVAFAFASLFKILYQSFVLYVLGRVLSGELSCTGTVRPRGYKTFFMLNSVEHEILNAYKYKNIKKFGFF